ncbi:MAG: prepilin-type N-terminal cleavage/methylation domain-containing protein [Sulfuritalea sp.]|nr:prepilin-type N-terminal cleavage/methylation domain-containing protein [Sulfuritalea sp.]
MTPLRRGFTLIELMVVMAIIAVLLTIAAPRYFNHLDRAREATLRQTLAVVRDAIDKFHGDTSSYPESLEELVTKRYLRAAPIDPITDSAQTWVLLPPPAANGNGKLWDLKSGAEGSGANGTPYAEW